MDDGREACPLPGQKLLAQGQAFLPTVDREKGEEMAGVPEL
jgi:hypothetical protein